MRFIDITCPNVNCKTHIRTTIEDLLKPGFFCFACNTPIDTSDIFKDDNIHKEMKLWITDSIVKFYFLNLEIQDLKINNQRSIELEYRVLMLSQEIMVKTRILVDNNIEEYIEFKKRENNLFYRLKQWLKFKLKGGKP